MSRLLKLCIFSNIVQRQSLDVGLQLLPGCTDGANLAVQLPYLAVTQLDTAGCRVLFQLQLLRRCLRSCLLLQFTVDAMSTGPNIYQAQICFFGGNSSGGVHRLVISLNLLSPKCLGMPFHMRSANIQHSTHESCPWRPGLRPILSITLQPNLPLLAAACCSADVCAMFKSRDKGEDIPYVAGTIQITEHKVKRG